MEKKTAIVFGLTSNHIFAVATVIMDLKKYSPLIADEIVIFSDLEIKKRDKNILTKFFPIKFLVYDFPIEKVNIFNQSTLSYFSKMCFSKYECLRLLNEYKTVMWLDYDIVITRDISDLMQESIFGIKMMSSPGCTVLNQLHEPVADYDMYATAICASTFVFHDNLKDFNEMYEFCYLKLFKYAKYLHLGEQAIFDFMIQEFKIEYENIDVNSYSLHPSECDLSNNAKILHAFGQPKFWNGLNNQQWNDNYLQWIIMGGTKNRNNIILNKLKMTKNYFLQFLSNKIKLLSYLNTVNL